MRTLQVRPPSLASGVTALGEEGGAHTRVRGGLYSGPKAIMLSIFIEVITGYAVIAALTFSIQGYWGDLYDPMNQSGGQYPVAQILYDVFYNRFQSATGAYIMLILMVIPFLAAGSISTVALAGVGGTCRTRFSPPFPRRSWGCAGCLSCGIRLLP